MGGSNVLAYPFESSEALPKQVVLSPANVRYDWEPQGPHTWLIVHRPYPLSPNDSVLSRIDAMLAHVPCRILGAYSLRELWCITMTGVETAEKNTNMKRMAFDWWPLSFNQTGMEEDRWNVRRRGRTSRGTHRLTLDTPNQTLTRNLLWKC